MVRGNILTSCRKWTSACRESSSLTQLHCLLCMPHTHSGSSYRCRSWTLRIWQYRTCPFGTRCQAGIVRYIVPNWHRCCVIGELEYAWQQSAGSQAGWWEPKEIAWPSLMLLMLILINTMQLGAIPSFNMRITEEGFTYVSHWSEFSGKDAQFLNLNAKHSFSYCFQVVVNRWFLKSNLILRETDFPVVSCPNWLTFKFDKRIIPARYKGLYQSDNQSCLELAAITINSLKQFLSLAINTSRFRLVLDNMGSPMAREGSTARSNA